jgi:hypothetical protein
MSPNPKSHGQPEKTAKIEILAAAFQWPPIRSTHIS